MGREVEDERNKLAGSLSDHSFHRFSVTKKCSAK